MEFLKLFFRCVALLPGVVQGVETLFGAKSGVQKKDAVLEIVSSSLKLTDAIDGKTIVDGDAFSAGLGTVIDGVVACLNASLWHKA